MATPERAWCSGALLFLVLDECHDAPMRKVAAVSLTLAMTGAVLAGAAAAGPQSFTFDDATRAAGITFTHQNGASGAFNYPELFGGGVVVLDIDGDRWPDLLFVNGKGWTAGGP